MIWNKMHLHNLVNKIAKYETISFDKCKTLFKKTISM